MKVKITTEFITLGQLLKITDWISSGKDHCRSIENKSISFAEKAEEKESFSEKDF